jgi:hypothetical protein
MGRFLAAVIAGVIATVIGGLILNQLQGKGRRRGDVPEMAHLVASLPLERATPNRLRPRRDAGAPGAPLRSDDPTPS